MSLHELTLLRSESLIRLPKRAVDAMAERIVRNECELVEIDSAVFLLSVLTVKTIQQNTTGCEPSEPYNVSKIDFRPHCPIQTVTIVLTISENRQELEKLLTIIVSVVDLTSLKPSSLMVSQHHITTVTSMMKPSMAIVANHHVRSGGVVGGHTDKVWWR